MINYLIQSHIGRFSLRDEEYSDNEILKQFEDVCKFLNGNSAIVECLMPVSEPLCFREKPSASGLPVLLKRPGSFAPGSLLSQLPIDFSKQSRTLQFKIQQDIFSQVLFLDKQFSSLLIEKSSPFKLRLSFRNFRDISHAFRIIFPILFNSDCVYGFKITRNLSLAKLISIRSQCRDGQPVKEEVIALLARKFERFTLGGQWTIYLKRENCPLPQAFKHPVFTPSPQKSDSPLAMFLDPKYFTMSVDEDDFDDDGEEQLLYAARPNARDTQRLISALNIALQNIQHRSLIGPPGVVPQSDTLISPYISGRFEGLMYTSDEEILKNRALKEYHDTIFALFLRGLTERAQSFHLPHV